MLNGITLDEHLGLHHERHKVFCRLHVRNCVFDRVRRRHERLGRDWRRRVNRNVAAIDGRDQFVEFRGQRRAQAFEFRHDRGEVGRRRAGGQLRQLERDRGERRGDRGYGVYDLGATLSVRGAVVGAA